MTNVELKLTKKQQQSSFKLAVEQAIVTLYSHWKAGTLDSVYGSGKLYDLFSEDRVLSLYREIFKKVVNV